MNDMIKVLVSICLMGSIVACTESTDQDKHGQIEHKSEKIVPMTNVAAIIAEAEKVHLAAREKEHAWTVTGKHLKDAKEALAAGRTEAALVSAERALITAKASLKQAEIESVAWKDRALKTAS